MQAEASPSTSAHLNQRYSSPIWSCLDADLVRSAVFYAERYYVHDAANHDARHLYATALLRSGQPHSAHHLVDLASDSRCSGCLELKARCCSSLGRHRKAREALEQCTRDPNYLPTRTSPYLFMTHVCMSCIYLFSLYGQSAITSISRASSTILSVRDIRTQG